MIVAVVIRSDLRVPEPLADMIAKSVNEAVHSAFAPYAAVNSIVTNGDGESEMHTALLCMPDDKEKGAMVRLKNVIDSYDLGEVKNGQKE